MESENAIRGGISGAIGAVSVYCEGAEEQFTKMLLIHVVIVCRRLYHMQR